MSSGASGWWPSWSAASRWSWSRCATWSRRGAGHRARWCDCRSCRHWPTERSTGCCCGAWLPMSDLEVYSIALTTRFRGIDVREGVLLRGDAGWGEFSPFLEYDDPTAAPWLAAALEAAELGWPDPVRTRVPVNVTVPACSPEQAREIVLAS